VLLSFDCAVNSKKKSRLNLINSYRTSNLRIGLDRHVIVIIISWRMAASVKALQSLHPHGNLHLDFHGFVGIELPGLQMAGLASLAAEATRFWAAAMSS
jgi:hypothetical protein